MSLNTYNVRQLIRAYLTIAERTRYRREAPSDGLGHVQLTERELADDERLRLEAVTFAKRFGEAEDRGELVVGYSDGQTLIAFAYAIEAAQALCGGGHEHIARALLAMAVEELDNPTEIADDEAATIEQMTKRELAAARACMSGAPRTVTTHEPEVQRANLHVAAKQLAERYEEFLVYENCDGTFHLLATHRSGGQIVIQMMEDCEEAEWVAKILNVAIGRVPQ